MIYELEKMCSDADFDKERAVELLKKITDVDQEFLDSKYKAKSTLLDMAAEWSNYKMVKLLLENGANPNLVYDNGTENVLWNLQYAEEDAEENKIRLNIVKLLLENGANPNINIEGDGLLEWAISCWGDDVGIQSDYRDKFICILEDYDKMFEINDMESGLAYVKKYAPAVYKNIQFRLNKIDNTEKNTYVADFKKKLAVDEAVLEAFELTSADAVITGETNGHLVAKKILTKKRTVSVPGKYEFIDDNCFCYCPHIVVLIFGEGVTHIGDKALCDNNTLYQVYFPETLRFISCRAFRNCRNLSEVTFSSPHTHLFSNSFEGTKWFENLKGEFVIINGFLLKYNGYAEEVILPEGTVTVDYYAFEGNQRIKTLICPSTLEEISAYSFSRCCSLQKVVLNENIDRIASFAFADCTSLKEIELPRGLKHVACAAFDENTTLVIHGDNEKFVEHIKKHFPNYRFVD